MISSPKPPDPYEQASAQAGANIDSAVANDLLNNRTEITPTGRIDYIDQGTRTITDSQGKQREIPVRDRVITLSDGQQKILDLTEDTSKNLLDVAKDRSAFLSQYFEDGINTDDLTAWRGAPEAPKLDTSPISFGEMELYGGSGKDVLYGYEGSDTELGRVERPGDLLTSVPLKTDFSGISVSGGGGTSRVSGDIAGTGEGIQDTVDLNTSGGAIDSLKRDFNADRLSGEIAGAGPIRTDIGYDGLNYRHQTAINRFDTPLDGVGEVRRSLGVDDYAAERDDVEDAIMSRYNRHFAEVESQLDQKLRAQGLVPGSEAYDRQFRQMREMQTDASMQAILAGGQEQSRLFGLDRDAALFENSAQQQAHTQSIDRGRFGLDVNRQNNETTLAADRFFNESVGMSFQKALEEATFGNASQGQQFGQNLQQALTRMNAAERNATIAQMRAQLHNDAQRTFFEQTLANAGFGNRATLDMGDFVNRSQQQRFSQHAEETARRIAAGSVNNQAADIENRHAVAAANLELQAQKAENDALLAQAGFNNAAVTQGLTNDLSATGFNNAAALAEIDNAAAAAGFYNASQGQNYTQDLGLFGFNNAATQQNNQNTAAAQSALNQYLAQQYGLDDASAAQNNALRQAQLQEEFALRGQPLNEIAALMSGSQLMMPQFTAPFQTGVPPVPIADYIQKEKDSNLSGAYNALTNAMDDAMERSILARNPGDLSAWKEARNSYQNLSVIKGAATADGSDAALDIIAPSELRAATIAQHGHENYARGKGDFAQLARAGEGVMRPLPNRGIADNLKANIPFLRTGSSAAIGGTVGTTLGGQLGGAVGTAIGAASPIATGQALMSRPVQKALSGQRVISNEMIEAMVRHGIQPKAEEGGRQLTEWF